MSENIKQYNNWQNFGLLLQRFSLAAIFLFAGYAKLLLWNNPPTGMTAGMLYLLKFLTVVEPIAALAVIFGFLTRWAAAGMAIIMIGAILILRFTMNVAFFTAPGAIGYDYNLLLLAGAIILIVFGAGDWSIDRKINRR